MRRVVEEGAVVEAWDVEGRSHATLEDAQWVVHPVGHGAGGVFTVADLLQAIGELSSVERRLLGDFIPDAPHDDRRAVAELMHEVHQITLVPLVEVEVVAVGHLSLRPAVEALCHHGHAHLITETDELWGGHIVRGADGIDAHVLHGADLASHGGFVHRSAERTEVMMEASALELQLPPVQVEAVACLQFDRSDPEGRRVSVEQTTAFAELDDILIEVRLVDVPELGMLHVEARMVEALGASALDLLLTLCDDLALGGEDLRLHL